MLETILTGMWDDEEIEVIKDRLGVYIIGLEQETQDLFWQDLAEYGLEIQNKTVDLIKFQQL